MSNDALLNELSKQLSDELNKYTHYLLAIAGAAMSVGLDKMEGKSISEAPAALLIGAIISWALSFGFGIRQLNLHRKHMIENAKCLCEELTKEETYSRLNPIALKAQSASLCQYAFLLGGALFYFFSKLFGCLVTGIQGI